MRKRQRDQLTHFLAGPREIVLAALGIKGMFPSTPSFTAIESPVRLIFFCSCKIPYTRASAVGGQPGT